MLLLQLSAAQGPEECCLAVAKALKQLQREALQQKVTLSIADYEQGVHEYTYRSVLVAFTSPNRAW